MLGPLTISLAEMHEQSLVGTLGYFHGTKLIAWVTGYSRHYEQQNELTGCDYDFIQTCLRLTNACKQL